MLLKLFRNVANTMLKRRISIHNASRPIILGIETSCDDTAVAIVSADKKVLASRILVNREIERQFDGIVPGLSAIQHRSNIDRLVDECLDDVMCRVSDLDAIAVTTTPGMVICLKVGIEKAISLARLGRRPIIPVHHMRAHALSARLVDENVHFPFLTLLISGGHTILAVAHGPSDFDVIGIANGISAGECIDKVGREHHNPTKEHVGALVEQSAVFSNPVEEWIIEFKGPFAKGADFNFEAIKTCFLSFFENYRGDTYEMEYGCPRCYLKAWPDGGLISANLLFHVSNHLCQKLHVGMDFPPVKEIFKDCLKTLVVSGGVAANQFILDKIKKIADFHGFQTVVPPKNLCTDNAEMIAWTGIEIMNKNSSEIIPFENLPSSIYAHGRSEIGTSKLRQQIIDQGFKPKRKIRSRSLLTDRLSFSGKPINKI